MSLAPSAPSTALPLLRLGLALTAAVAFALDAEPFHRYLRAVAITPELLQTEAPPGYLRVTAYTLLGFVLLLIAAQRRLGARSLHIALGIGFLLVLIPNLLASFSAPHYGVDSVSYTRYATGLLLEGKHPYADFEAAEALQRYPVRDTAVTYTNDGRLMNVFNYPPGSFLILAPLYVLGDIDPRWLYGLAFFFIAAMLLWRAPPSRDRWRWASSASTSSSRCGPFLAASPSPSGWPYCWSRGCCAIARCWAAQSLGWRWR